MSVTWFPDPEESTIKFVDQETSNYTKRHHTKSGVALRSCHYMLGTPQQQLVFPSMPVSDDTALNAAVEAHKASLAG